jgi:uncharacterized membrane protein
MLKQFQSYIIIGAIVLFVALAGSFALYFRLSQAEIKSLAADNATLSLTVALNKKTIDQMVQDAEKLNKSIVELSKTNRVIEDNFAKEWSAIDSLDLTSREVLADIHNYEGKINNEFQTSIDRLRSISGDQSSSRMHKDSAGGHGSSGKERP